MPLDRRPVDECKRDHPRRKCVRRKGRDERAGEVSPRANPDWLNIGVAEPSRDAGGRCGVAVHFARDRVDQPASAAFEAASNLREDVALNEVLETEDDQLRVPLPRSLRLVSGSGRRTQPHRGRRPIGGVAVERHAVGAWCLERPSATESRHRLRARHDQRNAIVGPGGRPDQTQVTRRDQVGADVDDHPPRVARPSRLESRHRRRADLPRERDPEMAFTPTVLHRHSRAAWKDAGLIAEWPADGMNPPGLHDARHHCLTHWGRVWGTSAGCTRPQGTPRSPSRSVTCISHQTGSPRMRPSWTPISARFDGNRGHAGVTHKHKSPVGYGGFEVETGGIEPPSAVA